MAKASKECISVITPEEEIIAGSSIELVATHIALDRVGVFVAREEIIPATSPNDVISVSTLNKLRFISPRELVSLPSSKDLNDRTTAPIICEGPNPITAVTARASEPRVAEAAPVVTPTMTATGLRSAWIYGGL